MAHCPAFHGSPAARRRGQRWRPAVGDTRHGAGIPGTATVTRTALQNAASIAGLMITTEAMVAEAPKKDAPAPGGGGGMGGMGDMDF